MIQCRTESGMTIKRCPYFLLLKPVGIFSDMQKSETADTGHEIYISTGIRPWHFPDMIYLRG